MHKPHMLCSAGNRCVNSLTDMSQNAKEDMMETSACTRDSFLGGRVLIVQPREGFRAGMDSVLLAASVSPGSERILELGAGVGTAACCVMKNLPAGEMVLVEKQSEVLELASFNLQRNGFSKRAMTICLDVTVRGSEREAAGLKTDHFSSVIANPPFFDTASGTPSPDTGRATARQMGADQLELWVRTAAASASPGGETIFIHLASALPNLLAAFANRFGAITVLPIVPRPDGIASRVLVRGIKGSRAPLKLLSPLVLHTQDGRRFNTKTDRIFRGESALLW